MEILEGREMLTTFIVNTTADELNGATGGRSLREAIQDAATAGDIIQFDPTAPGMNGGTINLLASLGEIAIPGKSLTIDASMLSLGITIDANDPTPNPNGAGIRVFNITDPTFGETPPLVILIGLTFTGGDPGEGFGQGDGGAIRSAARLIIQDCVFENNEADAGGAVYVEVGGGDPNTQREVLRIENSIFRHNDAASGAGVAVVSGLSHIPISDTLVVTGGTFFDNETFGTGIGGGLYAELYGSNLTITDTTFELNDATSGAGMYAELNEGASIFATGLVFDANEAGLAGGGLHLDINSDTSATIENSIFAGNQANTGGGGIFAVVQEAGSLAVADSIITGNIASDGGGMRVDIPYAGHVLAEEALLTIERSRLEDNTASSRGGGLYTTLGSGAEVRIEDSVITGNEAGTSLTVGVGSARIPDSGGGVYAYLNGGPSTDPAHLIIAGTEISENTAGRHGGGLAVCTKRDFATSTTARVSVYNTTISGNQAGHTTDANYGGTGGGAHLAIFPDEPEEALDAHFQNVTITNNVADTGGGIWSFVPTLSAARNQVWLTNSIASLNRNHANQANNLYGSFNIDETQFNIFATAGNTTFDYVTHASRALRTDAPSGNQLPAGGPVIGALAWNGGRTRTHRLLSGSPAIDQGSTAKAVVPFTTTALTTDQRGAGFTRPFDLGGVTNGSAGFVDIGAYEVGIARVIDVRLDNPTSWTRDPYSYAEIVPTGLQLAPIYTGNVTTIELQFSEQVSLNSSALTLYGSSRTDVPPQPNTVVTVPHSSFSHPTGSDTASWTFTNANALLIRDKYRLELTSVTNLAGNALDGEWTNDFGEGAISTPDVFTDDEKGRIFVTGNGTAGGIFTFFFSLSTADYNQDGVVNAADDDPGVFKDGDGDGDIDSADAALVTNSANLNKSLPLRNRIPEDSNAGDYDDDEDVDRDDYSLWKQAFIAATGNLQTDGNSDGFVNAADYTVWRNNVDDISAWYTGTIASAGILDLFDPNSAPQILNVIVSGSQSVHDPFHMNTVDGSGAQLVTVPVGNADTLSLVFSEDVTISSSLALRIFGLYTANVPSVAQFSYDTATLTATWRFDDLVANDMYVISLASGSVTDLDGNELDGEWVNPSSLWAAGAAISEFPSGNGTAGGDFNFVLTLLSGDYSQDNEVDTYDYYILSQSFSNGLEEGAWFTDGDGNADGAVNSLDFPSFSETEGLNRRILWILADLDEDFDVDQDDWDILEGNLSNQNADWEHGDLNGDDVVDAADVALMTIQDGITLTVSG
jgi:CSLREA domain-containing protein